MSSNWSGFLGRMIDLKKRTLPTLREDNGRYIGLKREFAERKGVFERLRANDFLHCLNVYETYGT